MFEISNASNVFEYIASNSGGKKSFKTYSENNLANSDRNPSKLWEIVLEEVGLKLAALISHRQRHLPWAKLQANQAKTFQIVPKKYL